MGAVLVAPDGKTLAGIGYNGAPKGFDDSGSVSCVDFCPRGRGDTDLKSGYGLSCPAVHAEVNALISYPKETYQEGTLYVNSACCADCAKTICNSGIKKVVMRVLPEDKHREPEKVIDFIESCGIEVDVISQ